MVQSVSYFRKTFLYGDGMIRIVTLLLVVCSVSVLAQKYREVSIPTRVTDNAKKYLLADVYSNDTVTPKPVILIQTPYNKMLYRLSLGGVGGTGGAAVPYDTAHYNYVTVDWRGFYANTNAAITPYNRGLDGYDIVEWIATQPWCNGKVGTWGGSALGMIQFQTATQQPPHLVCAAPFIKDFLTNYEDYYYGGDYRKEHVQSLVKLGFTTEATILSHPLDDAVWRTAEKQSDIADKITVPLFMCSGWFDHYPEDVLRDFENLRNNSAAAVRAQHKLMFGPWIHQGIGQAKQGILEYPDVEGVPVQLGLKFFDYYMRGVQNGWASLPTVQYYVMGDNQWKSSEKWPLPSAKTATLYFHMNHTLSSTPPPVTKQAIPPDTLLANPRNPVPTIGGSRFNPTDRNLPMGPQDIQQLLQRNDVLYYSTDELTTPVSVMGNSDVRVYFRSSTKDADISVRLCDIYPDGKWVILTQGIERLRLRNSYATESLLTVGALDSCTVHLNDLAINFPKGHKIGLLLSGTNYPMFDINPNSGGTMYTAGDTVTANTLLYHTHEFPARFTYKTTDVVSLVEYDEQTEDIQLYPNPSSMEVVVHTATPCTQVTMYDALGIPVYTVVPLSGNNQVHITTAQLPSGCYTISAETESIIYVRPCIIVH
ncbi:MAG: CocE/NonD family hydrolase [Bacteriodetes bacterium]|nr:CocE/NonD family hydrolase [Bacteroidota bacterium]